MNGLDLAKRIRKVNSKVLILLITGFYIKDMLPEDEFREVKITEVLLKPTDLNDLGPHIIKLCSNKQ